MNVAPVSPDGKYITFLSSKSLFSYRPLPGRCPNRAIKKLTSRVNTHIDEFNFIESAGAWSPDGKQFAFSVFNKGRNRMLVECRAERCCTIYQWVRPSSSVTYLVVAGR
jgi:hypothetical protein